MGGENVEQVWYALCLIKAVITLFVASVIVLLCNRFLRCIRCNRAKRRRIIDGTSAWHSAAFSES